jgi:hypothetical protein
MGYFTNYNLNYRLEADDSRHIYEVEEEIHKAMEEFEPQSGNTRSGWLRDVYNDNTDSTKWYNHEDEMREFSKQFPDVIFELSGEGEESGDLWTKYFKGGKMQKCQAKIVIPPYDARELK